jgi:hypothetical protein
MLLSPASLLLSKVPQNRQFPVVLLQGQNSHTDFLVLCGITSGKRTIFTDVLKIRNPTIFTYIKFSFYRKPVEAKVNCGVLRWRKSTDDSLKSQSK